MATRRVDGDHHDIAVANETRSTRDTLSAQDPIAAIRPTVAIAAPAPAGDLDLEAPADIDRRRAPAVTRRSPHQWVADFIEPRITDPTVFQGGRSLSILEQLASDIIPNLDESEELRSLAGAIIADEIERHRELASRLHGGIAP